MNYTSRTKQIICETKLEKGCELSLLSAVIHTCSTLSRSCGGTRLTLTSSNENLHELVFSILGSTELGVDIEAERNGRDTVITSGAMELLERVRIVGLDGDGTLSFVRGIAKELINTEAKRTAYLKGVFLGAGSFSPSAWHLEIGVSDFSFAEAIEKLIAGFDMSAHVFGRKDKYIVYIKKREDICGFFGCLGATGIMFELLETLNRNKTKKSSSGTTNLEVSNLMRTIDVSVEQIEAIKLIEEKKGLSSLGDKLYEVAKLRLGDAELSYDDMAAKLGISKGSVKYRLKKLMGIAETLRSEP